MIQDYTLLRIDRCDILIVEKSIKSRFPGNIRGVRLFFMVMGGGENVDLRGLIVKKSGSIRRFAQENDLNLTALYGVLVRKRNASKSVMQSLVSVFGPVVVSFFDADGILLRK